MTVAELIEKLKGFPQDATVVAYQAWGNDSGPDDADRIETWEHEGIKYVQVL